MIYLLFFLLVVGFFLRLVVNTLYALWLWQIKEYRFDRVWVHLLETKEGRGFLFNQKTFFFSLLFLAIPLSSISSLKFWYLLFASLVFLYDAKDSIYQIRKRLIRRPVFTIKIVLVSFFAFLFFAALFLRLPLGEPATMIVVDRLIFPTVSFFVLLTFIPTAFAKFLLMELAKRKVRKMKKLLVIGVTGSYGKSSTKEIIAELLSLKFSVLKTPNSVNTDVGIATCILKTLRPVHEALVVEIGAYKRGEIASVCNMIRPKIGVLTGINEQHLSLFGDLENTKKAKMELVESLPKNGMAFFNGDDPLTFEMAKWSKVKKTYIYSSKKKNPFLSNRAAAFLLAQKLGIDEAMLGTKLKSMGDTFGIKRMKRGNATILDDSFNTNPAGFRVALDMLSNFPEKKILITGGIIELGSQSQRIHKELGKKIGKICDVVILTSDNFAEPIREGVMKTEFSMKHFLTPKREELTDAVYAQMTSKTVILLEGRMPTGLFT